MSRKKLKTKAIEYAVYKPNYPIIKLDQFARVYIRDDHIIALIFEKTYDFGAETRLIKDVSLLSDESVDKWFPLKIMGAISKIHLPEEVREFNYTSEQIEYPLNDGIYHMVGAVRYNHNQMDSIGRNERKGPQKWMLPFNNDVRFHKPYNIYPETVVYKDIKATIHTMRKLINSIAYVFVPYEDSPFSECVFLISNKCWVNKPAIDCEEGMPGVFTKPSLQIIGDSETKEDVGIWMYIEMTPGNPRGTTSEVYLETTAGYISKQRVKIGEKFMFLPLGLQTGDEARLKVGWANYPGVAEKILKVT